MDPVHEGELGQPVPTGSGLPPETGDPDIDAALADLVAVTDESLGRHIEVGEAVHEVLRGRLGDLGGA